MLRQHAQLVSTVHVIADMAMTILSFLIAYWLRSEYLYQWDLRPLASIEYYGWLMILIIVSWSLLLYRYGAYHSQRMVSFINEFFILVKAVFVGSVLVGTMIFIFKFQFVSRTLILIFIATNLLFLGFERLLVRAVSWSARKRGYNFRTIIIVGTGAEALEMGKVINNYRQWGLRVVGLVSVNESDVDRTLEGFRVIGSVGNLELIVHSYIVDEVIFALPVRQFAMVEDSILMLEEQGINVRLMANIFPHVIAKVQVEELEHIPLLTFSSIPSDPLLLAVKRIFDIIVSLSLLVFASPVMAAASIAIKVTSPGPVLFRQKRSGLNGRTFTLLKFRSMYADAEQRRHELEQENEMRGPVFKIKDDPRITPVGRFIRKTSIDELPQLWNVLKGDMSIVGPRPPIPSEVEQYQRWQRRRLSMRPGLTCLWQISGRNKITEFDEWVRLDLQYIDTWSMALDFKIFLKTIPVVLLRKGAE